MNEKEVGSLLKSLVFEIPKAIETVYAGWSQSVKLYGETKTVLDSSFQNAKNIEEKAEANAVEARQKFEALQKQTEEQASLDEKPDALTNEEIEEFTRDKTAEKVNKAVVEDLGKGIDNLEKTAKERLTKQNSAAIRSLLMKYGKGIKQKTGLELDAYIGRLCEQLSKPYRDIAPSDARHASALDLLESIDKIESNLLAMIRQTVFKAKQISSVLLEELKEIENNKIFCM